MSQFLPLVFPHVVAEEDAGGPGDAVSAHPLWVHVHGDDAFAARSETMVFKLARSHVPGKDVTAAIGLHTGRWNPRLLHVVDDAVVADVRGEPELAACFDEVDVALSLGNGVHAFLARRLGQVAEEVDRAGARAKRIHARAHIRQLGA